MTHDNNLIRVLADDHSAIEEVFGELEAHRGHIDQDRKALVDHALAETVRHWTAEERLVYPELRRRIPDGDALISHEIAEHRQVEDLMKDLEVFGPEHPHFEQKLREFIDGYRHHVEDEERNLVPKLESSCSEAELDELGDKMLRAKEKAPTRPNPHAAQNIPAERVLGPGAGFIDRIRDSLSGPEA